MRLRKRPISFLLIVVLTLALLAPPAAFAGNSGGKPADAQPQAAASQKGAVSDQANDKENGGGSAEGLPVLGTEPADGAVRVRPDAAIKIVFDAGSKAFKRVSEQLEKGHFYVTLNGRKVEAAYNGRDAVEAKPGLLERYTDYAVEFVLHPDDQGKHLGFGNGQGKEWENKTHRFSFKTGSALHEPRHAKISVSSARPRVTEGAEIELAFIDDYGQPGWGAKVKVSLEERGARKPGSAAAEPSEFTVPEGSDGKATIRISDTEAEKVSWRIDVSGPYAEDAAQFDGEITFRPGPAAKVSLSLDREKVVAGQKAMISGAAEDVYGNPVEDGTPVSASASAGEVSGATTSGGAFELEFAAPTKKQTVALTVRIDQAEAKLDVPVVADAPAKVTVTPEKTEAEVGQTVPVGIYVEDKYGNPVEDGTKVAVSADLGAVAPDSAETKDGAATVELSSDRAGVATVTATAENGVSGSAAVTFKAATASLPDQPWESATLWEAPAGFVMTDASVDSGWIIGQNRSTGEVAAYNYATRQLVSLGQGRRDRYGRAIASPRVSGDWAVWYDSDGWARARNLKTGEAFGLDYALRNSSYSDSSGNIRRGISAYGNVVAYFKSTTSNDGSGQIVVYDLGQRRVLKTHCANDYARPKVWGDWVSWIQSWGGQGWYSGTLNYRTGAAYWKQPSGLLSDFKRGKLITFFPADTTIYVWDLSPSGPVLAAKFAGDNYVPSASTDGEFIVVPAYRYPACTYTRHLYSISHGGLVRSFVTDGKYGASIVRDGFLFLAETPKGGTNWLIRAVKLPSAADAHE